MIEAGGRTYDDSAFTPASIPMAADIADPIALSPDTWADRNLRVELYAHLEVAFEGRFRDGIGARRGGRVTLEAIDHGVKVTLLRSLVGGGDWGTINCFVQDWVVRIMFLHCAEIIGTLKQMRALSTGVFRAYGLAVDALCRETLCDAIV